MAAFGTCHKFGGTSVANANCYKQVAELVKADRAATGCRTAVVVSAMSKITDALINALNLARDGKEYLPAVADIQTRHKTTYQELLGDKAGPLIAVLDADCEDIRDVLRAVFLCKMYSERTMELISGYGEVWSAQCLNAYLQKLGCASTWVDARKVLVIDDSDPTRVVVQWSPSSDNVKAYLAQNGPNTDFVVITGYVAQDLKGIFCTLKRNGSDFSGSIFGSLLNAKSIIIWTDVDGVYSADPRRVPEAAMLDEMSYNEAAELAYFGAKARASARRAPLRVLHPHTMTPAIHKGIPIYIKNTFNASCPGTKIHKDGSAKITGAVKGFSSMEGIALVNVEGNGLIGVPGAAQRVFGALREVQISVILIAQSSSEHSICFAVKETDSDKAKETIEKAFFRELSFRLIETVEVVKGCAVIAVVGDNMIAHRGVAAKFFGALGRAGVNIRAIAQGSSERNITSVVDGKDVAKGLRAAHAAFFYQYTGLSIGVVGAGLIGGCLLDQVAGQVEALRAKHGLDLRVRGIAEMPRMLLDPASVFAKGGWRDRLKSEAETVPLDLDAFAAHLLSDSVAHGAVIVDCTASQHVADKYPSWIEKGIHIVTPNKKAFSGPLELYKKIQTLRRRHRSHIMNECIVGAGLPVLAPLRDLVVAGDKVLRIEGVLSGTLSFIFNTFSSAAAGAGESKPFSEIVKEAKALGYTEPDPRDDLGGLDVARKVVILAREAGLDVELSDLNIISLVPEELRDTAKVTPQQYLDGIAKHDAEMEKKLKEARSAGEVLRYVGIVDVANKKASVEMKRFPVSHPLATLNGADNMIAFTTSYYTSATPLVIRGPGAGAAVTAAGVFADVNKIGSMLGAFL
eukprot:tig00020554_g10819.t1